MRLADTRPPFAGLANLSWEALKICQPPATCWTKTHLTRNAEILGGLAQRTGCKVLLAQKAF